MIAHGRVQNGVVVLDDVGQLLEGQEVFVLPHLRGSLEPSLPATLHCVMDISPVSLGALLLQPTRDDDLLGEMLEARS